MCCIYKLNKHAGLFNSIFEYGKRTISDRTTNKMEKANKSFTPATTEPNSYNEVSALIEGVLIRQERFQAVSNQILRLIDDMVKRVDALDKNYSILGV